MFFHTLLDVHSPLWRILLISDAELDARPPPETLESCPTTVGAGSLLPVMRGAQAGNQLAKADSGTKRPLDLRCAKLRYRPKPRAIPRAVSVRAQRGKATRKTSSIRRSARMKRLVGGPSGVTSSW